jgi:hypothetical protein
LGVDRLVAILRQEYEVAFEGCLVQFVITEYWNYIVRQVRLTRVNETSRCSGRGSMDLRPVFLVTAANPVE